eukprot:CAMPEP_0178942532 /NCGR_PEP_ID=MMETSP0789-20121207/2051_1 /TAXON_ID=3005 /ORGANISM="Rhizosolenia setigera, Strain CCMP 1694" /LENGTH=441 /DNA_ID=CAMNT_0020621961 /DNA_START=1908 /DNA_END=3233 /DNA_ORIENTATION=-
MFLTVNETNSMVAACALGGIILFGSLLLVEAKPIESTLSNTTKLESIELADLDKTMYFVDTPPVSTLTWFRGNFKSASKQLENRMRLMIQKNPWLCGRVRVKYGRKLKLHLSYPLGDSSTKDNLVVLNEDHSPISRDTPMAELGHCLKNFMINNNQRDPIFRATIVPCTKNPNDNFAVMVQMSHTVGDGATYYKLLHMLLSTDEKNIVELNARRNMNAEEQQISLMGEKEAGFVNSPGCAMSIMKGYLKFILSRRSLVLEFGMVDQSKIEEMKTTAAKECSIPFVSTNDVITSWYLQQHQAGFGFMGINWRDRLANLKELDAGNYENVLFFRKEDSATPGLIRKSLKSFKRVVTEDDEMPGFWEVLRTNTIPAVTNWSTFAKKNDIVECEEDIHLPIFSIPYYSVTLPLLILYRARDEQLGLCYFNTDGVNHLEHAPFLKK